MDDDLVLNIAEDTDFTGKGSAKKGGRWTDRLKAKRVAKRKTRPEESTFKAITSSLDGPPAKRKRVDKPADVQPSTSKASRNEPAPVATSRPQGPIISSLFSYNPKVEAPAKFTHEKSVSKPSNAPLTDSSSFAGLGIDPLIVSHLASKMDIAKPTAIQRSVLPAVLGNPESQRDIFIQSQTGSGKTLSFLIPIIQDLLPLSTLSYIDRSIGTLAIIIAPTRELAKQISDVLEAMLKMRLRPEDDSAEDPNAARFTRWLVSGLLTGGSTRSHEKARLRKGLPIIVSTPGRLLDHLQHSSSFNVGKCRWLVLDEADRLMELGFEETITGIIQGLDGRRNLAIQAVKEGAGHEVGGWDWERRRRTVLCSATIKEDVQKLAGVALDNPLLVKAVGTDTSEDAPKLDDATHVPEGFTPPSQLTQRYVVAPLKQRLVVLLALLRNLISSSRDRKGTKIIVFLSCTDSVDYHWRLLGGSKMNGDTGETPDDEDSDSDSEAKAKESDVVVESPLLPDTSIIRLHGSLSTPVRLHSLREFASSKHAASHSAILFCTSVASRGLDLPQVRAVIQYDLPTEGGATEYVHRIGRTARAGKGGEAWSIVAPSEAEWVKWVQGQMQPEKKGEAAPTLQGVSSESVLQGGFGGKGSEYEARATDVQLSFERWVLSNSERTALAQQAFLSHMRAYATHPSAEKHIFHVRHLHIGHLAKAFALRDAPKAITSFSSKNKKAAKQSSGKRTTHDPVVNRNADTEARMTEVVRSQGRLTKKKGIMARGGTSEFQIAGGYDLEKLVNGSGL